MGRCSDLAAALRQQDTLLPHRKGMLGERLQRKLQELARTGEMAYFQEMLADHPELARARPSGCMNVWGSRRPPIWLLPPGRAASEACKGLARSVRSSSGYCRGLTNPTLETDAADPRVRYIPEVWLCSTDMITAIHGEPLVNTVRNA